MCLILALHLFSFLLVVKISQQCALYSSSEKTSRMTFNFILHIISSVYIQVRTTKYIRKNSVNYYETHAPYLVRIVSYDLKIFDARVNLRLGVIMVEIIEHDEWRPLVIYGGYIVVHLRTSLGCKKFKFAYLQFK